jgi:hypothetical protein
MMQFGTYTVRFCTLTLDRPLMMQLRTVPSLNAEVRPAASPVSRFSPP